MDESYPSVHRAHILAVGLKFPNCTRIWGLQLIRFSKRRTCGIFKEEKAIRRTKAAGNLGICLWTKNELSILIYRSQPGVSVAEMGRAHGVNAKQAFNWRRTFERGELSEPCAALIQVTALNPED